MQTRRGDGWATMAYLANSWFPSLVGKGRAMAARGASRTLFSSHRLKYAR